MWQQIEPEFGLSHQALNVSPLCVYVCALVCLQSPCLVEPSISVHIHIISNNYCLYLLCVSEVGREGGELTKTPLMQANSQVFFFIFPPTLCSTSGHYILTLH